MLSWAGLPPRRDAKRGAWEWDGVGACAAHTVHTCVRACVALARMGRGASRTGFHWVAHSPAQCTGRGSVALRALCLYMFALARSIQYVRYLQRPSRARCRAPWLRGPRSASGVGEARREGNLAKGTWGRERKEGVRFWSEGLKCARGFLVQYLVVFPHLWLAWRRCAELCALWVLLLGSLYVLITNGE